MSVPLDKNRSDEPQTINLSEKATSFVGSISPHAGWFTEARLGMVVHFGLYSLTNKTEWCMYFDKIPREKYNLMTRDFTASGFDAHELVGLAKRAGAGYVVLGARHHEAFCLWNTKTTEFNSVAVAKRDIIGEYTEACRSAGLRVGIYYSVMSWQWSAIMVEPALDPDGWRAMVEEVHEQIRELMSNYGKIDLLWYDGCVVPGLGDPQIRSKIWRSRELNDMARRLQPTILINDRAALPEDISTPEQHLTPAPRGRLWECCQTIGKSWSWRTDDTNLKSPKQLIQELIFCASNGGNYLINVGLKGDGSIPGVLADRMESIGRWMKANGESVRGSERTPYTEALHIIGPATAHANKLYFHLSRWPETPVRIAGIHVPIESARLLGSGKKLSVKQQPDGTATIEGLSGLAEIETVEVIELTLSGRLPSEPPPSLLVERATDKLVPAEAPVCVVEKTAMEPAQKLSIPVPASGHYHLELSVISERATPISVALDEEPLGHSLAVQCGHYPNTVKLENLSLSEGSHKLELRSGNGGFRVDRWRLQPIWTPCVVENWMTIGPFPTDYVAREPMSRLRDALQREFPPERSFDPGKSYAGAGGRPMSWQAHSGKSESISLAQLCGGEVSGICYGRMVLVSPDARALDILLGCDWWANLFVNGNLVRSERALSEATEDGAWFKGWKPTPARIQLHKGENTILVKCHPGSIDNWFTFFMNAPDDICIKPQISA